MQTPSEQTGEEDELVVVVDVLVWLVAALLVTVTVEVKAGCVTVRVVVD